MGGKRKVTDYFTRMKECLTMIIWLITSMTQTAVSVKCAECDFLAHTPISGIRTCPENCYGDVCFIVVNNYYNETLVSGCVNVDMETRTFFRDHAYCYKRKWYTVCGCTTSDRCNSPQAPFSMFTFVTSPFFEDCQFMPKQGLFPVYDDFDSSIEMTTENARIGDPLSVMTTPYPMVSSSTIIGIESVSDKSHSDNRNETIGEFVDEVMRSLLPNTDLQHFMDPEFNQIKGKAYKKINIRYDGNSCSRQYGISRIAILLIFSLLPCFYQLPKVNLKKN
uniref:Uncharacterized protein n=1 Tax=Wuchereria bancrofti TaxID=6293 RepID=A0A1I8EWA0_WUCBA